jgi:hypothetical protein
MTDELRAPFPHSKECQWDARFHLPARFAAIATEDDQDDLLAQWAGHARKEEDPCESYILRLAGCLHTDDELEHPMPQPWCL